MRGLNTAILNVLPSYVVIDLACSVVYALS